MTAFWTKFLVTVFVLFAIFGVTANAQQCANITTFLAPAECQYVLNSLIVAVPPNVSDTFSSAYANMSFVRQFYTPCREDFIMTMCSFYYGNCTTVTSTSNITILVQQPVCNDICFSTQNITCGPFSFLNTFMNFLNCTSVRSDGQLQFPVNGWNIILPDNSTAFVPCFRPPQYTQGTFFVNTPVIPVTSCVGECCNYPWEKNPQNICVLNCPLPIFSPSDWYSTWLMQVIVGYISVFFCIPVIIPFLVIKQRRRFPNHLPLMLVVSTMFVSLGMTFSTAGIYSFYCPEPGVAVDNTYFRCQAQGIFIHTGSLAAQIWWLILCFNLGLVVTGLFNKIPSLPLAISYHSLAVVFPIAFVIAAIAVGAYQSQGTVSCTVETAANRADDLQYTPTTVVFFLGLVILIPVVVRLFMLRGLEGLLKNSRLLLLLLYWFTATMSFLIFYWHWQKVENDSVTANFTSYIFCNMLQNNMLQYPLAPGTCEKYFTQGVPYGAQMYIGFIGASTGWFSSVILGWTDVRLWRWWFNLVVRRHMSSSEATSKTPAGGSASAREGHTPSRTVTSSSASS